MSTLDAVRTTASAPAASAARRTVPALPGSRTSHSTAISRGPASSTVVQAHVQEAADRENALRGDRVRHRGEDFVGGEEGGGALGECLQVRVPVQAGLARVDLVDNAGLPRGQPLLVQHQGFPDRLRPLGQELAAL